MLCDAAAAAAAACIKDSKFFNFRETLNSVLLREHPSYHVMVMGGK